MSEGFSKLIRSTRSKDIGFKGPEIRGVGTSARNCPVTPYITDVKPLIDLLAEHTEKIWIYGLSILSVSDLNWQNVDAILEQHFSELKLKIEDVVLSKEHAYWCTLRHELLQLQEEYKPILEIHV